MLNTLSKIDMPAISPMTDQELAAVEGGALQWAVVGAVGAYVGALYVAWQLGEEIGDWLAGNY